MISILPVSTLLPQLRRWWYITTFNLRCTTTKCFGKFLLAKKRVTRSIFKGLTLPKKVKTSFSKINALEHLYLQYNFICIYSYFFSLQQSRVNGGSNGRGLVIILEVKTVFTYKKFSVLFAFKNHSKKNTEILSKTVKKSKDGIKNGSF